MVRYQVVILLLIPLVYFCGIFPYFKSQSGDYVLRSILEDSNFSTIENTWTGACPFNVSLKLWAKNESNLKEPDCHDILYPSSAPSTISADWFPGSAHDDTSIISLVSKCDRLRAEVFFPDQPLSEEERLFPLAYVFVGLRNADQTLRLFRMLYWPQNAYCFTYDDKAGPTYKQLILALAACFPDNVQVNPHPIKVYWAHESVLHNVMPCFPMLLNSSQPWRYVQVVSYNDFPLKTNLELVRIMKILNGSNDSELKEAPIQYWYYERSVDQQGNPISKKRVAPGGLIMFQGSYATTMTREFVHYFTTNPLAKKFYKWLHRGRVLEELYWPTLIHNTVVGVPGAFPGHCLKVYQFEKTTKPFLSRYQLWAPGWGTTTVDGHTCLGQHVYGSCVYGVADVKWLRQRSEFIAHKVYADFQPAAAYCMEKWHWEKVCTRATQFVDSKDVYYRNLPAVRYQNSADKDKFTC